MENQHSTTHNSVPSLTVPQLEQLSWPQRLQIRKTFKLSAKRSATLFKCSASTLQEMMDEHVADGNFDTSPYASIMSTQRRGRKSSKIQTAYNAATITPQHLIEFCETHGVSINTITQCARFNRPDIRIVTENKVRMIVKVESDSTTSTDTAVSA